MGNNRRTSVLGHCCSLLGDSQYHHSSLVYCWLFVSTGLAYDAFGTPRPNEYYTQERQNCQSYKTAIKRNNKLTNLSVSSLKS